MGLTLWPSGVNCQVASEAGEPHAEGPGRGVAALISAAVTGSAGSGVLLAGQGWAAAGPMSLCRLRRWMPHSTLLTCRRPYTLNIKIHMLNDMRDCLSTLKALCKWGV